MSAPLPCCTSTRPMIARRRRSAASPPSSTSSSLLKTPEIRFAALRAPFRQRRGRSPRNPPPSAMRRRSGRRRCPAARTARGVVGLDAAAVQQAASASAFSVAALQAAAQHCMHRLRLLRAWRCARCRSPRPARRRRPSAKCNGPAYGSPPTAAARRPLSVWPASRSASVSPTQTIGVRPWASARLALSATSWSDLAVVGAALRMADDHVAAAEFGQHRRRHLAGVGAAVVRRAILRAPGDAAALQRQRDIGQIRKRHADRDFGSPRPGLLQRGEQVGIG